jgi:hypothetical protein
MTPTSKTLIASAATLFTLALFSVTAPAAQAAEFCITNGAQAAHGCGYPTMEACQAASSGIGGMCSERGGSTSASDAFAQAKQPAQSAPRTKKQAVH